MDDIFENLEFSALEIQEAKKDLPDGVLKKMQSTLNIPEVKLFVPFYKTITNIFLESSKRNPVLAGLMPSVYRDT